MKKLLIIIFTILFLPILIFTGYSSWIITTEETITVGKEASSPVAYIEGFENIKYTKLDAALKAAKNKNPSSSNIVNIVIIPGTTITVSENIVLDSYMNLYLPYQGEVDNSGNYTSYTYAPSTTRIAEMSSSFTGTTYRMSLINMTDGADIIINKNASLYIGGENKDRGITGYYSEIKLDIDSSIECYGELYIYGYIKENTSSFKHGNQTDYREYYNNDYDKGRYVKIYDGGYAITALGIYDTKDSVLVNLVNADVFPYNQFDFPNVQTLIQIMHGAKFDGQVNVEPVANEVTSQSATIVSSNSSDLSLFFLNSGSVSFEYCPSNGAVETTSTGTTRIYIDGAIVQGYLSVTAKVKGISYPISTKDLFLPISYKFNIFINNSGSYQTNYKIKFLPGSLFKIQKGATVTINSKVIFYKSENSSVILKYGTTYEDAKLINNGTLTFGTSGAIGATILTELTDTSATIDFTNCSEEELSVTANEYDSENVNIVVISEGYFDDSNVEEKISIFQFVAGSKITSSSSGNKCWYGSKFAVYHLDIIVTSTTYTYNVLAFEVYTADDSKGTNSKAISSGVMTSNASYNIPIGSYYRVNATRHKSATFTGGSSLDSNAWYEMTTNKEITIVPNEGVLLKWSSTSISGAGNTTYTISEREEDGSSFYNICTESANASTVIIKNAYFKISARPGTGTSGKLKVASIDVTSGPSGITSLSLNTEYQATTNYTIKFNLEASACFARGTMITLGDGTIKAIENITNKDKILSFNHETGKFDSSKITVLANHGYSYYQVIKLKFENNITLDLISTHGLLNANNRKYVNINIENYSNYIGQSFIMNLNEKVVPVKLIDAILVEEYTESYTIVSAINSNHIINNMVGITTANMNDINMYNIFELDTDYKYDLEKMKKDIEKYGLYTYEEWKDIISYETFIDFNVKYMKIIVGKGVFTEEDLIMYLKMYEIA